MKRRLTSILLTLVLLSGLAAPALAADTASVIRLTKTSGTVSVSKSSGKSLSLISNMRLYNGYHVNTSSASYAWLNLDDTKLLKEDASSDVAVQQSGKKLEVKVWAGSVFFDVSQKLGSDESLNISTSTMIVGVRGTSGYVQVMDRWTTRLTILEGTVVCSVSDPVTGQVKTEAVRGGETVECVVYPQEQTGDKCDILRETTATGDIPGFVLTDLARNVPLCDKILDASGLDILRDLAAEAGGDPSGRSPDGQTATPEVLGETDKREAGDKNSLQEKLDKLEQARKELEDSVSGDKALPKAPSSSGGSSSGGSTGGDPAPATFPVSFDANGGLFEGSAGQTVVETDESGLISAGRWPADPTNGDLIFLGWYDAQTGGSKVTESTVFTRSTTVYAHWSTGAGVYTITFDANGGSIITESDTSETIQATTGIDGKLASLPTTDSRSPNTGSTAVYRFDGWFDAPEGGTQITDGTVFLEDTTVYAHWTISGWDWAYDEDTNTLRVFGTGPMNDFGTTGNIKPSPWCQTGNIQTGITTAVIEDGITSIGDYAFYGCTNLASITIPDGVTSIGSNTFTDCSSLTSIAVPNSVTSIGSGTFAGCSSLTSITIPNDVTSIGSHVFNGCTALTSITIPNGVTSIGSYAFMGCTNLTSITIPDSVTGISSYAFYGCSSLNSITIPNGVTSIGNSTFTDCSSLTSITIPDSVTSIGSGAFEGCTALTSITIPNGVTSISDHMFEGCTALTSITIPDSVTSIGEWAFNRCSSLTSVTIPDSVTSIGDSAFESCDTLTSVTIPDSVTSIGEGAFFNCTSLTSITIPNGVTSIGSHVFDGCTALTSITIPNGVTSIGDAAFNGCSALTSITLPSTVTSIGNQAFWNCTALTSITLPSTVTSIGNQAFQDCTALTSITLPSTVTSIGTQTFFGCTALTSITIPNSVTSIGDHAFYGCTNLKDIYFNGTRAQWDSVTKGTDAIPDGVAVHCTDDSYTITFDANGGTFPDNDSGAESSTGGESIMTVETEPGGKLASLPSNPERSDSSVLGFAGWYTQDVGGTQVDENTVFTADTTVYAHWSNGSYDSTTKTLTLTGDVPAICPVISNSDSNEWTTIKPEVENIIVKDATSIGTSAFAGCTALTSVTLSEGITSIEGSAFSDCTALTSITLPSTVTSIGSNAFQNCAALTSITVPNGVTSISNGTFSGCSALTNVTLSEGITSIEGSAFSGCANLGGITLPSTVTSIGQSAFYNSGLTSITIPSGVSVITGFTFQDCKQLTSVVLSEGVTFIGERAFSGCSALEEITIPVTAISQGAGNAAFYNCNITTIHFTGTRSQWSSAKFYDTGLLTNNPSVACTDGTIQA